MELATRAASLALAHPFKGLKVEERSLPEGTLSSGPAGVTSGTNVLFPFQMSLSLQQAGLGSELAGLVAECVEARRGEGREAMLNAVAGLSCGTLENFDWQAKVGHLHASPTHWLLVRESCRACHGCLYTLSHPTPSPHPSPSPPSLCAQVALASDRVGSVQEQFVVLQLTVTEGGGVQKHHQVELNRAELDTLLASLEGCSKVGGGGARIVVQCSLTGRVPLSPPNPNPNP